MGFSVILGFINWFKTLVPFRLSGNIYWGVKVPDKEELLDDTT